MPGDERFLLRYGDGWGQRVAGRCPACGSDGTLFVAVGQHVTCDRLDCPDPTVVADFLQHPGPPLHVVQFGPTDWHLEHTMRCRIEGMADCLIHQAIAARADRPGPQGRYQVAIGDGGDRALRSTPTRLARPGRTGGGRPRRPHVETPPTLRRQRPGHLLPPGRFQGHEPGLVHAPQSLRQLPRQTPLPCATPGRKGSGVSGRNRLQRAWRALEDAGHTVSRVPLKGRSDFELHALAADAEHRLSVLSSPEARDWWMRPEPTS